MDTIMVPPNPVPFRERKIFVLQKLLHVDYGLYVKIGKPDQFVDSMYGASRFTHREAYAIKKDDETIRMIYGLN